jgi:hypothetical protein
MQLERLERYFDDYTYIRKGHYPVTDMLVYWYMGEAWTLTHKEEQIAVSEGLLRSIEANGFNLKQPDVERLFELYDLRNETKRGKLSDAVMLQSAFTEIIETYHLAH